MSTWLVDYYCHGCDDIIIIIIIGMVNVGGIENRWLVYLQTVHGQKRRE